ncbi:MAG TPA: MgtC/SapB family protein [Symbiobacteriaceae bacterium]
MTLTSEPLAAIALATGLGLLIGLERERSGKEAGLRTFSLTALAGAMSTLISPSSQFAMITLGFVAVVIIVLNLGALHKNRNLEMTTSAALFVTAMNGILVGMGNVFTPVAATIIMLLLLAWKEEMVLFTHHLSKEEVHAGITLLLLALVILPTLPNVGVDPWGLVVPRRIWIMVVMISGIGFTNYLLLRFYGARGVDYTGFLGGVVNSTAAVGELANQARENPALEEYTFRGIMLAKTAMFLRNGLILAIFAPSALQAGIMPVLLMLLVTFSLALYSKGRIAGPAPEIKLTSPFSLRAALEFGLVFLLLTIVAGIGERFGGNSGFYAVSFLGGLVSSSSTTATAANLASQNAISPITAGRGVLLTSIASAVVLVPLGGGLPPAWDAEWHSPPAW